MISAAKAVRCSANGATILCSLFTTGQIPTIQCVDSEGIFLSEYRTGSGTLGTVPDVPKTVDDFDDLLKVMNTLELTEFQYLVSEDEWTVSIR